MKRIIIAAAAVMLALCLCACGQSERKNANLVPLSPGLDEQTVSESDAAGFVREAPASGTDTAAPAEDGEAEAAPDGDAAARYELAQSLVGHTAGELFEALGEPVSSDYAASCETDDAEDGMQQYDGFYVWTLRTADEEIVRAVYLDD